jgi:phage terminase large subunit GpA-like protein
MDAITDHSIKKIVVMSAAQIGKTEGFVLNTIGYYVHYEPSPIMVIQPTDKMAESFSKERLAPSIDIMPVLNERISDKSRNSGNTILQKMFPGGHIVIVGANSPTGLRSRAIRILLADEIDAYPPTAGKEGDPLAIAEVRTTTFWNRKEVCISTPTVKHLSRIAVEYENSTKETWNVPCPVCGAFQRLEWTGIVFDKTNPVDISYKCEKCGSARPEVEWKERQTDGRFIAEFPKREVRGFHLNALASNFTSWREIVVRFLEANEEKKRGNIEPLKVWTNTQMGQVWEEEGTDIDADMLFARRELYECEVPDSVICLTAGIDTQDDRFEIEVVGWGVGKESYGIKYHVIWGDLKQPEIWNELSVFLTQTFTRADGTAMKLTRACIDTQGHFYNEVLAFCKERSPLLLAIRGQGGAGKPFIPRPTKTNREKVPLYTLGVDTGKVLIYSSLAITSEGANYAHFPMEDDKGYGDEYFEGLTAEKMVLTYRNGRAQNIWKIKDTAHRRNEPLDCRNYAQAALEISGVTLKTRRVITGTAPAKNTAARRTRSKGVTV